MSNEEVLVRLEAIRADARAGYIIAAQLVETFGIEPYLLPDGRLGLHFMHLDHSRESALSLIDEIGIESYRDRDGVLEDEDGTLRQWRSTLQAALALVDAALAEEQSASNT